MAMNGTHWRHPLTPPSVCNEFMNQKSHIASQHAHEAVLLYVLLASHNPDSACRRLLWLINPCISKTAS